MGGGGRGRGAGRLFAGNLGGLNIFSGPKLPPRKERGKTQKKLTKWLLKFFKIWGP